MATVNLTGLKNLKSGIKAAAAKDSKAVSKQTGIREDILLSRVFSQEEIANCIGRGCHVKDGACECGWWASQSTGGKVAIVAGGALLVGSIGYLVLVPPKRATPNRRRRRGKKGH